MEKYRPYVLLGVAVIVALITSYLAFNYLKGVRTTTEPVSSDTHPIATAMNDLSWGTKLTKEVIQTKPFLKESLPSGYIDNPESLVGRVIIYPVKANQPILESSLAPVTVESGGIAAIIKTQKRAIAVKVDKIIGVSGFINPGNRVDVLVTIDRESKGSTEKDSGKITKTVLENMLVLAAGQEMEEKKEKGETKSVPVDVITLEVTPEEGEKLALAASEGRIQLALRNFNDTEEVLTKGSTIPTLLTSFNLSKDSKKEVGINKQVQKRRPAWVVEKIIGNSVSEKKFNEVNSK